MRLWSKSSLTYIILLSAGFFIGVGSVWVYLKKDILFQPKPEYQTELDNELLKLVFDQPMISKSEVITPATLSAADFVSRIFEVSVADTFNFDDLFERITLDTIMPIDGKRILIGYHIGDYSAQATTFHAEGSDSDAAVFYIPSSAENGGYRVFHDQQVNEAPAASAKKLGRFFVLEKPGDGSLAIHNGYKKFNLKKVLPYLVNHGRSYSLRYILDALAISKYLQANYKQLHIWGCSQGGQAAMLLAQWVKPSSTVVASGYSVKLKDFYSMDPNQLISSGIFKWLTPETIIRNLENTRSRVLISYGKGENDIYGMESRMRITEGAFRNLKNFSFLYHDGGHQWPNGLVEEFYGLKH